MINFRFSIRLNSDSFSGIEHAGSKLFPVKMMDKIWLGEWGVKLYNSLRVV